MEEESRTFEAKIELGALLNIPIYESHKRGKNWLARITKNPAAPGGLEREFAPRAHGEYYYILPISWEEKTPIEFGADYYSGGGRKNPTRWYGWILTRTEEQVIFVHCSTSTQAIKNEGYETFQISQIENPTIERKVIIQ